jgi:hypothetical protein
MMQVWSYGGGVQSVAIGVLIGQQRLPRPSLAGIADTGREVQTTWAYLDTVMQPFLDRHCPGLRIEVVPHSLSRVDVFDNSGLTLMPAYTRTENGMGLFGMTYKDGRLPAFCSGEWKRDTMERWYRLRDVEECQQWIGYSADEMWRVKNAHRPWCQPRHPLIELKLTREDCKRIITEAGLPLPHKSRCWCCPHQDAEEWREVKSRPEEFAAAVALEAEVNARDPDHGGELFLYSGRVPLSMATFDGDEGDGLAARPCAEGGCWT